MKRRSQILFMLFISLSFFSCSKDNYQYQILVDTVELSTEEYINETKNLREYLEVSYEERPQKYESIHNHIISIENDISKYRTLETVNEKKEFIKVMSSKLEAISQLNSIKFLCLNIDNDNIKTFNLIAEHEINRTIHNVYKKFYSSHLRIF